jgi:hypothetical protein
MTRKLICSIFALGLVTAALSSPSYARMCNTCDPEYGYSGFQGRELEKSGGEPKSPEGPPGPKNPRKEKDVEKKAESPIKSRRDKCLEMSAHLKKKWGC